MVDEHLEISICFNDAIEALFFDQGKGYQDEKGLLCLLGLRVAFYNLRDVPNCPSLTTEKFHTIFSSPFNTNDDYNRSFTTNEFSLTIIELVRGKWTRVVSAIGYEMCCHVSGVIHLFANAPDYITFIRWLGFEPSLLNVFKDVQQQVFKCKRLIEYLSSDLSLIVQRYLV